MRISSISLHARIRDTFSMMRATTIGPHMLHGSMRSDDPRGEECRKKKHGEKRRRRRNLRRLIGKVKVKRVAWTGGFVVPDNAPGSGLTSSQLLYGIRHCSVSLNGTVCLAG